MNPDAVDVPRSPAVEPYDPPFRQTAGEEGAGLVPERAVALLRGVEGDGLDRRRAHDHRRPEVPGDVGQDLRREVEYDLPKRNSRFTKV